MRLFLISKPGCHHITELMDGIKAVYQMEAEFEPYLAVDFLPNRNNDPGGVIVMAGNETIRKNYTFDDPKDLEELRSLLWKYLEKYHNPKDITYKKGDKKDCIKDFRETGTFNVIQGWQNRKKLMEKNICCRVVRDLLAKVVYRTGWDKVIGDHTKTSKNGKRGGAPDFSRQLIKHPVYRYDNRDLQDREICKKVRYKECGDNYPPGSMTFKRCLDEVTWLCNNAYPVNKVNKVTNNYRNKLKESILEYLKKNNMKVNKKVLDTILSAGFFERVKGRVGNKAASYTEIVKAVDDSLNDYDYYAKFIEGFVNGKVDGKAKNSQTVKTSINRSVLKQVLILFSILLLILYFIK